jgi:Ser/Thr protein kinase RdoA (MazF antagonist)
VLFEYIIGKSFPRQPDISWVSAYGQLNAQFHLASDKIGAALARPQWKRAQLLDVPLAQFRQLLYSPVELIGEIEQHAERLSPMLDALSVDAPGFGLIHGDVIPSNALIATGDRLYLIDFELTSYGWRMYDVATFLNEIAYWNMGKAAEAAFLGGYESVRPISDAERAMIPVLGATRSIWGLGNAAAHVNLWGSHLYLSERVIAGELDSLRRNMAKIAL